MTLHIFLFIILPIVLSILGGTVFFHFLFKRQYYQAYWIFITIFVVIILSVVFSRVTSIKLTPKLKIEVAIAEMDASMAKFRYPFQEYSLFIANENLKSVPIEDFKIEFLFPNIISQVSDHISVYAGGPIWVSGMRTVKKKRDGSIHTAEEFSEAPQFKTMDLSIQKWKKDDELINSHTALFNSKSFNADIAFHGSIVIDLSKKWTEAVKTPEEVESYKGEYSYEIMGKEKVIKIQGVIPKPNIELKLAEHHYDQGRTFSNNEDYAQAIPEYSDAIKFNPEHNDAYYYRGFSYGKIGDNKKALSDFNTVIENSPKYKIAYYNRAIAKRKIGEYKKEDIKNDFYKAWQLGLDEAFEKYLSLSLDEINPNDGFLEHGFTNKKFTENNGDIITIIPHVIKDNFEIHGYKDKDNVFKLLISNAFSEKVILRCKDLGKLINEPKHTIKVTWHNGENKLYIDETLVDIYPQQLSEPISKEINDSFIFRELKNIDPEIGTLFIKVSREEWLKKNSLYINVIPHIMTDNFEIHGYRDTDNIFKLLIRNDLSKNKVILQCKDIDKFVNAPNHPNHTISITWNKDEYNLYIDGDLVDKNINNQD